MFQILHLLFLHGIFPGWVGGATFLSSTQTSMSLRFLGRRNATMGGLGMAFLSLSEICKIGRYLGCVAEAGMVGYYQRYPLDGVSWFRMGRERVGSGYKGCSLNLSTQSSL